MKDHAAGFMSLQATGTHKGMSTVNELDFELGKGKGGGYAITQIKEVQ